MDVLSNILSIVHISGSLLADIRFRGNVGVDFGTGRGAPFHYILEGQGWLVSAKGKLKVGKGDLLLVSHWDRHELVVTPLAPTREIARVVKAHKLPLWTHGTLNRPLILEVGRGPDTLRFLSGLFTLEGRGSDRLLAQLPGVLHLDAEAASIAPQLQTALAFVSQESSRVQPGYEAVASRLMDLLFIQILRAAMLQRSHDLGALAGIADPKISLALAAMHAEPGRRWTLAGLAAEARLSRTLFAHRFRQTVGVTPMRYLCDWRLHLAEDALRKTHATIEGIRADLGFQSQFAFSRAFKRLTGLSPSKYRRDHAIRSARSSPG